MLTSAKFAGGARELALSADTVISRGNGSHWDVTASSGSLKVKLELPASWLYGLGYPVFVIHNAGGTHTFTVCKNDGTTICSVTAGQTAKVGLYNLTGQGSWAAKVA